LRRALLTLIAVECSLLAGGLGLHLMGALERFQRPAPPVPVFRPPIDDTRIGDSVRYQKRDKKTGAVLGYLDYEVRQVVVTKGTTAGPQIILWMTDTDAHGNRRERSMVFQPRALMDGFLPPRFEDEDAYPAGERPVVKTIETATFPLREVPPSPERPPPPPVRGFLVDAVIPRKSLTEVAERYWMTDKVPVFGVVRWERGDEVLVAHTWSKPERRG
jgi:hypothetical protein